MATALNTLGALTANVTGGGKIMRVSVRMSGKDWGGEVVPEQIRFTRMGTGGVGIEIKAQKGYTEGATLVLSEDVAAPFSRALQNIVGGLEGEVLTFPRKEQSEVKAS